MKYLLAFVLNECRNELSGEDCIHYVGMAPPPDAGDAKAQYKLAIRYEQSRGMRMRSIICRAAALGNSCSGDMLRNLGEV